MEHERRPRGRPRMYHRQRWKITMMLSAEVVAAIDQIAPDGRRSEFIEAWLRTHPQVVERLSPPKEQQP